VGYSTAPYHALARGLAAPRRTFSQRSAETLHGVPTGRSVADETAENMPGQTLCMVLDRCKTSGCTCSGASRQRRLL